MLARRPAVVPRKMGRKTVGKLTSLAASSSTGGSEKAGSSSNTPTPTPTPLPTQSPQRKECIACMETQSVLETKGLCSCEALHNDDSFMCLECTKRGITSAVNEAFQGSCPIIKCFCTSDAHPSHLLTYSKWKQVVSKETAAKYASLAGSLLSFRCSKCHSTHSNAVKSLPLSTSALQELQKMEGVAFAELMSDLLKYERGLLSTEQVYMNITSAHVPSLQTSKSRDAWNTMEKILQHVESPERRNNLHLRHLRARPHFWTSCCTAEHCWKCKTVWHKSSRCIDVANTLDNTIVYCDGCGIALVKGDGCDSLTCLCGRQFSWSNERRVALLVASFIAANPVDTAKACALALCDANLHPTTRSEAVSYKSKHDVAVCRELIAEFIRRFSSSHYLAQCVISQRAVTLPREQLSTGVQDAQLLWTSTRANECKQMKQNNELALRSLFTSLCPNEVERPLFAMRLLGLLEPTPPNGTWPRAFASLSSFNNNNINNNNNNNNNNKNAFADSLLISSARQWAEASEANRQLIKREHGAWEMQQGLNFLRLFGGRPFLAPPEPTAEATAAARHNASGSSSSFPTTFNFAASNKNLTWNLDHSSVTRKSSISTYPCAFASLTSSVCSFSISIEKLPNNGNWLTFGLAKRGFKHTSSTGIGASPGSWGLRHNGIVGGNNPCLVSSCGVDIAIECRRLQEGDCLTAMVNLNESWLEVSINKEWSHRFVINDAGVEDDSATGAATSTPSAGPASSMENFYFVVSLANDTTVSIIDPELAIAASPSVLVPRSVALGAPSCTSKQGTLNPDHAKMLECMRSLLNKIYNVVNNTALSLFFFQQVDGDRLAAEWQEECCKGIYFVPNAQWSPADLLRKAPSEATAPTPVLEQVGKALGEGEDAVPVGDGEDEKGSEAVPEEPNVIAKIKHDGNSKADTKNAKEVKKKSKPLYLRMKEKEISEVKTARQGRNNDSVAKKSFGGSSDKLKESKKQPIQPQKQQQQRQRSAWVEAQCDYTLLTMEKTGLFSFIASFCQGQNLVEATQAMTKGASMSEEERALNARNKRMSWQSVLNAVCWCFKEHNKIEHNKKLRAAQIFKRIHGLDAAFIAAMNFAQQQQQQQQQSKSVGASSWFGVEDTNDVGQQALSYFEVFPEEANAWYANDAASKEPLITTVDKKCRFLPRHANGKCTCPKLPPPPPVPVPATLPKHTSTSSSSSNATSKSKSVPVAATAASIKPTATSRQSSITNLTPPPLTLPTRPASSALQRVKARVSSTRTNVAAEAAAATTIAPLPPPPPVATTSGDQAAASAAATPASNREMLFAWYKQRVAHKQLPPPLPPHPAAATAAVSQIPSTTPTPTPTLTPATAGRATGRSSTSGATVNETTTATATSTSRRQQQQQLQQQKQQQQQQHQKCRASNVTSAPFRF